VDFRKYKADAKAQLQNAVKELAEIKRQQEMVPLGTLRELASMKRTEGPGLRYIERQNELTKKQIEYEIKAHAALVEIGLVDKLGEDALNETLAAHGLEDANESGFYKYRQEGDTIFLRADMFYCPCGKSNPGEFDGDCPACGRRLQREKREHVMPDWEIEKTLKFFYFLFNNGKREQINMESRLLCNMYLCTRPQGQWREPVKEILSWWEAKRKENGTAAPGKGKDKPDSQRKIVDRWEDLTLYRMNADKMLSYRVREARKIRSVHCDGIGGGLSKGASRFLLAILNDLPVEKIKGYNAGSRSTILNELRKKLSAHFGPTEKPFRGNGKSPRFKIRPFAQVLTGPERDPLDYDD